MTGRATERVTGKTVGRSTVSRMRVEKNREQLELLRGRQLNDADCICMLVDGVWLTKEICVVVAVTIDTEGNKRVLDLEGESRKAPPR